VSAFYNDLNDLLSTDLLPSFTEASPLPARKILPVTFANGLHGNSQGVEATGDIRPRPWWRLTANYSYVYVAATRDPGSTDVSQERAYEDRPARHQVQAGSSVDVSSWSFDWLFRHVSEVRAGNIPSYNASTLRAAWHPVPRLELSIVSQDLFEAHHLEWPSGSGGNVEIRRSVYGQITWGH
jgi:iron complex outermembrane receptor protein